MLKVAMIRWSKKNPLVCSGVPWYTALLWCYIVTPHPVKLPLSKALEDVCWPPPWRLFPHPLWFHDQLVSFEGLLLCFVWTFCLYSDRTVKSGRKWGEWERYGLGSGNEQVAVGTWTRTWYRKAAACIIAPPLQECFLMQLRIACAMLTTFFPHSQSEQTKMLINVNKS